MSNKPPMHNTGKESGNLSWQQQLLSSTSSPSLSHQNNNNHNAHRKRGDSSDRRRPSHNSSRGYQGGKGNGYNRSRRTPPRRSPTVRESGGNGNTSLDFGQLSVAQIKKRLPDALKTRNYKLVGLLLRNAPGKPMLTISSGDPLNFSMLGILRKLFGAGQTTQVADFILKIFGNSDINCKKVLEEFSGPRLVEKMVEQHRFDYAMTYLGRFGLDDDINLKGHVFQRMIKEGQYDRCLAEAERLKIPDANALSPEEKNKKVQHLYKSIVTYMIRRGRVETALKHIEKLRLSDEFDIEDLFKKLYDQNNFTAILRFAGRYNLLQKYPVNFLIQNMLDNNLWAEAWKTVQMKGLSKTFPLRLIIEKASDNGDFSIVTQFIEDHNLAPRMSKTLDDFENKLMNQIVEFEKKEEELVKKQPPSSPRRPSLESLRSADDGSVRNEVATGSSEVNDEETPKPIVSIEYPPPPSKNRDLLEYVVKKMIEQRKWYFAMKYVLDYNLATIFPPVEVIEKVIDDEAYSLGLRYIVGLGEYDSAVAEKFFPMLPFIREERSARRIHFLTKDYFKKKTSNDIQQNTVSVETIVAIETRDMESIADIKDAKIEINIAALNGSRNASDGALSPSSSLLNMLKGSDARESSLSVSKKDASAMSRSMMLKASLDAFDDSMALHEENDVNHPESHGKHRPQQGSVASNSNGDIGETNSVPLSAAKTFKDEVDTDGNSSDDEEEIVLLSPGRQSSQSRHSHKMAAFGAPTNIRPVVNSQSNQQLHQQNSQGYFHGQKNIIPGGNMSLQGRPLQSVPPNQQHLQNQRNNLPRGINVNARQNLHSMQQAPPQMQPSILPNQMPFLPRGPAFTQQQQKQQHQDYIHRNMRRQMPPNQPRFFSQGPNFPPQQQHQPTMYGSQPQVARGVAQQVNRQLHPMQRLAMPPSSQKFFKPGQGHFNPFQAGLQARPTARPTSVDAPSAQPKSSGFALPIYMSKRS